MFYFPRLSSLIEMGEAKRIGNWYKVLYWAKKYKSEGGTITTEEWESILKGCVYLDELGFSDDYNI